MKNIFLAILCLSITPEVFAQNELVFNDEHVVSVFFRDYTEIIHGDSCMLYYIDTSKCLMVVGSPIRKNTEIYKEALTEMQNLLNEIGHNRNPSAEDLGISATELSESAHYLRRSLFYYRLRRKTSKERCSVIRRRLQSLDTFNLWLQEKYPVYDEGELLINTIHDPSGMKIIVGTDKQKYYFDMRDIELFQPYLMRTSDMDCLKLLTNFRINLHLNNVFKALKINRKIPFSKEIIELYTAYCIEEYQ